jgi:hypothetical protein
MTASPTTTNTDPIAPSANEHPTQPKSTHVATADRSDDTKPWPARQRGPPNSPNHNRQPSHSPLQPQPHMEALAPHRLIALTRRGRVVASERRNFGTRALRFFWAERGVVEAAPDPGGTSLHRIRVDGEMEVVTGGELPDHGPATTRHHRAQRPESPANPFRRRRARPSRAESPRPRSGYRLSHRMPRDLGPVPRSRRHRVHVPQRRRPRGRARITRRRHHVRGERVGDLPHGFHRPWPRSSPSSPRSTTRAPGRAPDAACRSFLIQVKNELEDVARCDRDGCGRLTNNHSDSVGRSSALPRCGGPVSIGVRGHGLCSWVMLERAVTLARDEARLRVA